MFLPSFTGANANVAFHNPDASTNVTQLDPSLWNVHSNEFDSFTHAMIMNDFHNNSFDADVDLDKNGMWIQTMQNNTIIVTRELFFQNDNEFIVVEKMKRNSNGDDIVMQKNNVCFHQYCHLKNLHCQN